MLPASKQGFRLPWTHRKLVPKFEDTESWTKYNSTEWASKVYLTAQDYWELLKAWRARNRSLSSCRWTIVSRFFTASSNRCRFRRRFPLFGPVIWIGSWSFFFRAATLSAFNLSRLLSRFRMVLIELFSKAPRIAWNLGSWSIVIKVESLDFLSPVLARKRQGYRVSSFASVSTFISSLSW